MRTYRVEKGERKHKNQTNIRFWCETKGRIHYIFGANRPQYVYFSFSVRFFSLWFIGLVANGVTEHDSEHLLDWKLK